MNILWLIRQSEQSCKDISERVAQEQGCRDGTQYWFPWAPLNYGPTGYSGTVEITGTTGGSGATGTASEATGATQLPVAWALVVPEDSKHLLTTAEQARLQVEQRNRLIQEPGTIPDTQLRDQLIDNLNKDVKAWLNGESMDMDPESRDRYLMWLMDPKTSDAKKIMILELLGWVDTVWNSYYYVEKDKILAGDRTITFDPLKAILRVGVPAPHTFREIRDTP